MFAVIKTGGKQYRVAGGDEFTIERLAGEAGDTVSFAEVLMVGTTIGAPFVSGASVAAEIVDQVRGPKVISFKKRRRQNSKRTRGHRQDLTLIRISEILTDGAKPSGKRAETAPAKAETAASPQASSEDTAAQTPVATSTETGEASTIAAPKKPRATKKKAEGETQA